MNKEGANSLQQPQEKPSQKNYFKACKSLKPHNNILNNKYQTQKICEKSCKQKKSMQNPSRESTPHEEKPTSQNRNMVTYKEKWSYM